MSVSIGIAVTSMGRPDLFVNAIESWADQSHRPDAVCVTDCSTSESDRNAIRTAVMRFEDKFRCVYVNPPIHESSRSEGRSAACRLTDTQLIVCTETDIKFPRTLIANALREFGDPPASLFVDTGLVLEKFVNGRDVKKPRNKSGACQIFRREDFDRVGGYNPFLKKWGYEDIDFRNRMLLSGCRQVWLEDVVLHQWHESGERSRQSTDENRDIAAASHWDGEQWVMRGKKG